MQTQVSGKQYRTHNKSERIQGSDKKVDEFLKKLPEQYNVAPLFAFLELTSALEISNTSGTKADFEGSDFVLKSGDLRLGCQDKRRMSGQDIQVEFVRLYRRVINQQDVAIVADGGRDLYQIPFDPLVIRQTRAGWRADRNWEATAVKNDVMIFHPTGSEDTIWLKSEAVKTIAKGLLNEWIKNFAPGTEFYQNIRRNVFSLGSTVHMSEQFGVPYDVFCLREESDKKEVKLPLEKKGASCNIAKAICYLPLSLFEEGKDYVVCSKKT